MSFYRRNRVPGGTYFFTVVLADRRSDLLVAEVNSLRVAVGKARKLRPFHIDAWVVLPDHMHCIWTLPEGNLNFSRRWHSIKTFFSEAMPKSCGKQDRHWRAGERGIWQRRFWEHTIRDEADYAVHMDYTHFNPVKHGYVEHPADWPFSSFRRSVELGVYPKSWAGGGSEPAEAGERR